MGRQSVIMLMGLAIWGMAVPVSAANLIVEVRTEGQGTANQQDMGIVTQGGGWGLQGNQRTVTRSSNSTQHLMVMDGGTATLSSVQTQPLRLRQTIRNHYGQIISENYVFRSLGGGVRVTPRSRSGMVEVEVGTEDARPVPGQPAATELTQLSTQIYGRMGEWILLGDDQRSSSTAGNRAGGGFDSNGGGNAGSGTRSGDSSSGQQVWLRVTAAP